MPSGTTLVRLFDPTDGYRPTALSFRRYGPKKRFDHHRPEPITGGSQDDPDRGIYYGAPPHNGSTGLSSCMMEVFGDTGIVDLGEWQVAAPVVRRSLRLLDLQGEAAMTAGTVAGISACEHRLSQSWSRYFYEHPEIYNDIDGILYPNAHNHEVVLALYERAEHDLACASRQIIPLRHLELRPTVLRIMVDNSLVFHSLRGN